jgi:hypothetical protein
MLSASRRGDRWLPVDGRRGSGAQVCQHAGFELDDCGWSISNTTAPGGHGSR